MNLITGINMLLYSLKELAAVGFYISGIVFFVTYVKRINRKDDRSSEKLETAAEENKAE